jgi:hypothetical protein
MGDAPSLLFAAVSPSWHPLFPAPACPPAASLHVFPTSAAARPLIRTPTLRRSGLPLPLAPSSPPQDASRLPPNPAIEDIPAAIAAAAAAARPPAGAEASTSSASQPKGVVVMVVQPGERNAYDQQVRRYDSVVL